MPLDTPAPSTLDARTGAVARRVPASVEELTPDWFTHAWRAEGRLTEHERVSDIRCEAIGNGLVCDSVRVELTYDPLLPSDPETGTGSGRLRTPESVVCKLPSTDPGYRAAAVNELIYRRELGFYRDLAASLTVPAPACLHLAHDLDTDDFVLVLEDLAPAVGGDQIAGCDLAQAEAVIDAAVGLHAPLWGDTGLEAAAWNVRPDWLPRVAATYPDVFAQFAERFADRLAEVDLAIGARFAPVIGDWFTAQPRPWTLTHGDYRLDNMLFDIRGGAAPVGILDWQTLLPGPGATDIAYFLGGCLTSTDRRAHEDQLLRRYHTGLVSHGVNDYSYQRCWRDYRYGSFLGYFMCSYAAVLVQPTERGDRMFTLWLQRVAAQIRDLDALNLLPTP